MCTRADLGLALSDPAAGPAEATKIAPVVELAPLGPSPLVGIVFVVAWMTTGLLTALVLSRRGHDGRSTGALGFVFGPLFVPLAIEAQRRRDEVQPIVVATGGRAEGPVDVLVVLQCQPAESPSALPILDMLGPRLGRLAVVRVLDFESMQNERERADAEAQLSCASLFLWQHDPELVLLAGKPCDATRSYAVEAGYDLVARVGSDRRGRRRGRPPVSEVVVAPVSPDEP